MNKKFSIRSNELIGAKLVLEVLEENAKLIYRKGDVIRCTGIFKKENIKIAESKARALKK